MSRAFDYVAFFETIRYPCIVIRVHATGFEIVDANHAYLELCALDIADIRGKDFFEVFPTNPYLTSEKWTDTFASVLALNQEVKLGIQKFVSPLNAQTTFLDVKYLEIQQLPLFDENGEIEFIVRTLHDVTQLVVQRELQDEAQQSIAYGNWWISTERHTIEWSAGFKDILEVPEDFQPTIDSIKHFFENETEEKKFYTLVDEAATQKTSFKSIFSIVTARGKKRWILVIGKPVIIENLCVGVRGIAKDITEKKNYVDQIRSQNDNLQKIAFAQSHLVRAPLARILALVQHLKQHYPGHSAAEEDILNALDLSAMELDTIIHDIVQKTLDEKQ